MPVCTAKLLSLRQIITQLWPPELQREDETKYLTFREGSYRGTEKQYFILSTFSTLLSSPSDTFFFFHMEYSSINIAILKLLQEIVLLHHLHVNGSFVGENSQFSWASLFRFKETSGEC